MMKLRISLSVILLAWISLVSVTYVQAEGSRQMVLTIDDLPYQAIGHPDTLEEASRVTDRLLGTFAKFQAPTTAFVNESNLTINDEAELRTELLEKWAKFGAILGNHTYSHADLNSFSVEAFKQEIIDGEPITLEVMKPHAPYPRFFFGIRILIRETQRTKRSELHVLFTNEAIKSHRIRLTVKTPFSIGSI